MYTLKFPHRLEVEAKGSLYTTPTLLNQRGTFYKGQNHEGFTPKA